MTSKEQEGALESLSMRLRDVQLHLASLKSQEVELKSRIAEVLDGRMGEIHAFGKTVFRVTRRKAFDADTAWHALKAKGIDPVAIGVTKTVVDREAAQQVLSPALYELCKKQSDNPTITPA